MSRVRTHLAFWFALAWLVVLALAPVGCAPQTESTSTSFAASDREGAGWSGAKLFQTYCVACHQKAGQGTEGRVPPLDDSPWVAGSEQRLIRIVLDGLHGPIEIDGQRYNLQMPAFKMILSDDQIADLLSYVRQQFGDPSPPISRRTVTAIRRQTRDRDQHWTVEELRELDP